MPLYSLMGPDIGVQVKNLAELMKELGDEAAIDAVSSLSKTPLLRLPGEGPPRLLRVNKDDDARLGWDYFARRAGVSKEPDAGAEEAPPADPRAEASADAEEGDEARPNQAEPQVFGERSNHLAQLLNEGKLRLHRAQCVLTIHIPVGVFVRCEETHQVGGVLDRYQANEPFEPGTGVFFDPNQAVAIGLTNLQRAGTFKDAHWTLEGLTASPMGPEATKALVDHLVHMEHLQFRKETEANVNRILNTVGIRNAIFRDD